MSERMTDERLAEIEAGHVQRGIRCAGVCGGEAYWPCDAVELVAEVRRLRAIPEASQKRAYDLAQRGCPTTRNELGDEEYCFYCSASRRGRWGRGEDGITCWIEEEAFDHAPDCPWPPFEAEANA